MKSPFSTKIERGAYTATVYKEGSNFIAEDAVGNLIIEGTDAATVIQKAIDDYAVKGLVLVKPDVTLTSALKILSSDSNVEFIGQITSTGVNAFEIGDATHQVHRSSLTLGRLDGVDKSAHGILFKNAVICHFSFRNLVNCDIGLYIYPCTGGSVLDNVIEGENIADCATAGIRFAANTAETMEGNHFRTSIYNCPIGFELLSGGGSWYQTFIGTIDCITLANSEDIKDAVGHQMFLCDFVREETCTISKDTLLMNLHAQDAGGSVFAVKGGYADFMNIGFTPLLIWDFNRNSTGDWSKTACTMSTPSKSVTQIAATGGDPNISRTINVDGGQAQIIIIRYKFVSGSTAAQNGTIFYSTGGHGISGSYYKQYSMIADAGEWKLAIIDMSDLTAGGTDWISNIITSIRIDYINSQSTYDIDFIAIGTRGYSSIYHMDDALKTPASASANGNKGDIRWDESYIYICTATDTWKRAAIGTW